MNNIKDYQEFREKRKLEIKEEWKNLKPFNDIKDIPGLPKVDKQEWEEFYVPILIKCGAIPKKDLIDGEWYYGEYRNSNFGKWIQEKNQFYIIRYKFGYRWDDCNHFEDDDGFALFVPLRKASQIELEEINSQIKEIK